MTDNNQSYNANPNQKVYDTPHFVDHEISVIDIFFAQQEKVYDYLPKTEDVKAPKNTTVKEILKSFKKDKEKLNITSTPSDSKTVVKKGETVTVKWDDKVHAKDEKGELKYDYPKINNLKVGKKLFIVANCLGEKGKLTIDILENKLTNAEVVYDNPVKFLIGEDEKTKIEFTISKEKIQYSQEITLRPKTDEDLKKLVEKFNTRTDKKAFLYLKGEVTETQDDIKFPDETHEFCNLEKTRLEVLGSPCYCNRDITVAEFKKIIKEMRLSEKNNSTSIFISNNCTLPDVEKTYERLTEEYNKVCKKYEIDTCIRKIHFFAQTYWEADRFKTTLEYSDGEYLNPDKHDDAKDNGNTNDGDGPRYKGRGLMQLTWRSAYVSYFNYLITNSPSLVGNKTIDVLLDRGETYEEIYEYYETDVKTKKKTKKTKTYKVDSASLVGSKIELAIDSAGWFWNVYKKVQYSKPKMKTLYKEILGNNLNQVADYGDKYVDIISKFVNGGGNGKANRKTYYESLRDKVFNIKDECINYDKIKK
jgi:predicted chitinase